MLYGGDVAGIFGVIVYMATLVFWFTSTEGR